MEVPVPVRLGFSLYRQLEVHSRCTRGDSGGTKGALKVGHNKLEALQCICVCVCVRACVCASCEPSGAAAILPRSGPRHHCCNRFPEHRHTRRCTLCITDTVRSSCREGEGATLSKRASKIESDRASEGARELEEGRERWSDRAREGGRDIGWMGGWVTECTDGRTDGLTDGCRA